MSEKVPEEFIFHTYTKYFIEIGPPQRSVAHLSTSITVFTGAVKTKKLKYEAKTETLGLTAAHKSECTGLVVVRRCLSILSSTFTASV